LKRQRRQKYPVRVRVVKAPRVIILENYKKVGENNTGRKEVR
jgi:hypothetical protein